MLLIPSSWCVECSSSSSSSRYVSPSKRKSQHHIPGDANRDDGWCGDVLKDTKIRHACFPLKIAKIYLFIYLLCSTSVALHSDWSLVPAACVVLSRHLICHIFRIVQLLCILQCLQYHCHPAILGSDNLWRHAWSFSLLQPGLTCIFSMLVVLPCEFQVHYMSFHCMLRGLVGGMICKVTCPFFCQLLLFASLCCSIQCMSVHDHEFVGLHTLVYKCLLISLLALVVLIRAGGLLLRVMSTYSISSSISFILFPCCCSILCDILLSVFFFFYGMLWTYGMFVLFSVSLLLKQQYNFRLLSYNIMYFAILSQWLKLLWAIYPSFHSTG